MAIALLGLTVLLCFQNCSQAVYQAVVSQPLQARVKKNLPNIKSAKAKTDFDDLLQQSERELNRTQTVMKSNNELSPIVPIAQDRYGTSGAVSTKSNGMKLKLVKKVSKKKKTNIASTKWSKKKNQDKKLSANQKLAKTAKSKRLASANKKASVRTPAAKETSKKIKLKKKKKKEETSSND